MDKHKNDIYGDLDNPATDKDLPAPVPAATVLLLRDYGSEPEVLMLHKTSKIAFGGMWVFPGGRIDDEDYLGSDDVNEAARHAAMRETSEEAGIDIPKEDFVWFSHWTPPPITPKRFATWFFVSQSDDEHVITIDGGEIQNHQWLSPTVALALHARGEIDLAPPTWVSLYHLSRFDSAQAAIARLAQLPPRYYKTRIAEDSAGNRVAMWEGDAGYAAGDASLTGPAHRLIMKKDGFEFDHSAVPYT